MTIYYVDGKNGSDNAAGGSSTPWKTTTKALAVVSSGDTVRFRGSKTDSTTFYRSAWVADVAGVTWENDSGHTPTWHGGYPKSATDYSLTGTVPGTSGTAPMIKIAANNVTLRGLRVQNVGGVGFTVNKKRGANTGDADGYVENALITQCESFYTYGGALLLRGDNNGYNIYRVKNNEVSYCTFMGMGLGKHDASSQDPDNADAVHGSVQLLMCENTHVHHNVFAYGEGEGVNVGRGSTRTILEHNIIHTMDHVHIAVVRCVECDVRYNVVFHNHNPNFMGGKSGPGKVPIGIRIGDEDAAKMQYFPHSSKQRVYGNLVIGGSDVLSVPNGGNFDTQLNQAYIGYNTFIGHLGSADPEVDVTKWVLEILARTGGAAHTNTIIENNIFYAPRGAGLAKVESVAGLTFRNNAWYSADGDAVPANLRSGGDVTGDPKITNPLRAVIDAYPTVTPSANGYNVDNYRLRQDSALIGAASNRSATNGLTPPTITADLTGAARTDLDRPNMRYFDIGALEYGGQVANSVTAGFSGTPRSGNAPLSVTFTDESLVTGAAVINSRSWTFGDGGTSTARNPSYTYSAPGTYTVALTVQDTTRGLTNTLTRTGYITVGSPPTDAVTAAFAASPRNGPAPMFVTFADVSEVAGAAVINTWLWDFGDGTTSTQRNPVHTYAAAGTYTVELTVQDTTRSLSDTETKTNYITVTDLSDVEANFTQSSNGGEAPLAVTFTDTSTESGAASIDRWVWEFGDGNGIEGVQSVPYIYSEAGTFTPRLTVYDTARGLSDSKSGTPIVITAGPPNGEPGIVDVVRQLLPGTAGPRTIAFNLRGHAPALVLLYFTRATVVNTAVDDGFVSFGAVTATEQWAGAFNTNDAADPSQTERYFTTAACIAALDGGALEGLAVRSSVGPDRLTIEVTDAFTGGYLTAIAFAGSQWQARAAAMALGAMGTHTALSPGFTPEWYIFGGTMARDLATAETNADFIMGMADGTTQVGYTWRDVHAQATTKLRSDIVTGAIFRHPGTAATAFLNHNAVGAVAPASSVSVGGGDFNTRVGWAALDIAGGTQVKTAMFESPTTPGTSSYSVGFAPTALLGTLSNNYQVSSPTAAGVTPESFSILAADVGATYSICVASANAAAATNSKTMVSDGIKLIAPDGSTIAAGTLAFTETGFDIAWSTVPVYRCYFNVTAFGATPSITGPIPQFEADDTTPEDGVVQFTDLSNPNGSAITAWSWSFGDDGGSSEQHPEHTYIEPGVYSVALTVTNANGAETILKTNYIHYAERRHWLLGPYESRPITRTSIDRIYGDDPQDEAYGFHEHAADFDALEMDAQPDPDTTAEPGRPGKAMLKFDWANRKIIIVWPDLTTSEFSED